MVMIEMLVIFTRGIMIVMGIIMVITVMAVGITMGIIGEIIVGIIEGIAGGIIEGTITMEMVIQTVSFDFIHMPINFKIIVKMDLILNFPSILTHCPSIHSVPLNHSSIYSYPYFLSITNSLGPVPLILVVYSELIIPLGLSHSVHVIILHELVDIIRLRIEITLLTNLLEWCLPIIHFKFIK